jgi:hypothetical protein
MERIEADLALGHAAEVIPEVEALVRANPLQERLRGQLMLALYRSGRQADALEVYRQTRELLNDELGLEPSKPLQELERSILRQERSLDLEVPSRAVAFVALAGTGVTALALDAPRQSSPGFLEQAEAALAPPDGLILHAKWQITRTSREYGCTVTSRPNEVWADPTSHRFRIVAHEWPSQDASDGRAKACRGGMTTEVGGEATESFTFVPPDTLAPWERPHTGSWDDVDHLRQALADGRAHMDGRTELAGRAVERIRIECDVEPEAACPGRPADYFYVDPETFFPVQFELPDALHYSTPSRLLDFDVVGRYLTYEYLPGPRRTSRSPTSGPSTRERPSDDRSIHTRMGQRSAMSLTGTSLWDAALR